MWDEAFCRAPPPLAPCSCKGPFPQWSVICLCLLQVLQLRDVGQALGLCALTSLHGNLNASRIHLGETSSQGALSVWGGCLGLLRTKHPELREVLCVPSLCPPLTSHVAVVVFSVCVSTSAFLYLQVTSLFLTDLI